MRLLALLLLAAAAAAEDPLVNASFENGLDGWEITEGAWLRRTGPQSAVESDAQTACEGGASLRLSGDGSTVIWRIVSQFFPCEEGRRVLFRVKARCRGVHREGNQYANANALLAFFDAQGRRLGILTSALMQEDRDWVELHVHALAPKETARCQAGLFLSESGTLWFDDARLQVASADPSDPAARAAAYEALRLHLDRTYPFFAQEGRPAPGELRADPANSNVAAELVRMLGPLKDPHVWIKGPLGIVPTGPANPHRPTWSETGIRARLTEVVHDRDGHLVGRIEEVGYALVGNLSQQGFAELEGALDGLDGARALILDLRANRGGDERLGRRIAGRFTDRELCYAKARVRDPTLPGTDGFKEPVERRFGPLEGREPDLRPVVVLQGPHAISSAEALLLMFRSIDRVTTLGLPSRGASGNPQPFPLFAGLEVLASSWQSLAPDGTCIEGVGVAPEIRFDPGPDPPREKDPTLAKALELLR